MIFFSKIFCYSENFLYLCTAFPNRKSATKVVKFIDMSKRLVLKSRGDKKKIAKILNTDVRNVYNALNFCHDSKNAEKIRFVAIRDFGAIQIDI